MRLQLRAAPATLAAIRVEAQGRIAATTEPASMTRQAAGNLALTCALPNMTVTTRRLPRRIAVSTEPVAMVLPAVNPAPLIPPATFQDLHIAARVAIALILQDRAVSQPPPAARAHIAAVHIRELQRTIAAKATCVPTVRPAVVRAAQAIAAATILALPQVHIAASLEAAITTLCLAAR